MAFKNSLAQRIFNITKISKQALTNCRISSPAVFARIPKNQRENNIAPDPGDYSLFRRFLHKRAVFQPDNFSKLRSIPIGENLMPKYLRNFDLAKDRIRLDGLVPPAKQEADVSPDVTTVTAQDARRWLKLAHLEMVKSRLGEMSNDWISYSEFVRVCGESCSDQEQGSQLAKTLDESGNVIVLGNSVCIKPEQVTKVIRGLIPLPGPNPNDPRRKEMEELETQKAEIDKTAESLVRRELWCGLGYLIVQTVGFMRLTFWELTWDVMEPICFYVTSIYFMAGYAFFLRTSVEPSFEGFYQNRFSAKQKRLVKRHNFDMDRYNELRKVFYPKQCSNGSSSSGTCSVELCHEKMQCALNH